MARSNKTRAACARKALAAYSDDPHAGPETWLTDLIADAAHLLGREKVERCTRRALAHFGSESSPPPKAAPEAPRDTIGAMDYAYEDTDGPFDAEGRL